MKKPFPVFEEARSIVRGLGLASKPAYVAWYASVRPNVSLPADPGAYYKGKGWTSWGDFLGAFREPDKKKVEEYLTYEEARKYVSAIGLKSEDEYYAWTKTPAFPTFLPKKPRRWFKDRGWVSMGDYLGTGKEWSKDFLPYSDCKQIARSMNFKSDAEWKAWAKTDQRPSNVPNNPTQVYMGSGKTPALCGRG